MLRNLNSNNNQNNYGWGNAVADILGAVMQRNQDRAQAEVMSDPLGWAQKQGQPQQQATTPAGNGQGLPNVNNFAQDLMNPNAARDSIGRDQTNRIAGINQPAQSIQQRTLQGAPSGNQGLLGNALGQSQGLLGNTSFNTQQPDQGAIDQQAQFDQAVQANPEWYRKGVSPNSMVYVGDKPEIGKDAAVTASGNAVDLTPTVPQVGAQTATKQQAMTIPNKAAIGKTYKEYGNAAIKKLVNSGMSPKDAIATVQNAINQRTEEDFATQSDAYAQELDSQLEPLMGMDFQTSGNKAKMLATLVKYNQGMKRIGREGADIGLMKELMGQGDVVMQKEDNGGAYRYVMVKKNGERFDDGSFQMAVPGNAGEWTEKQLSPGEKQQGELTRRGQDITMRGQDISAANSRAALAARSGSGVGGNATQKMNMYKWASGFSLQPTGEVGYDGKPVMTRVQNDPQLAVQLANELGYGGQGGGGEDPRIAAARAAGYSDEEIQQFIGGGAPQQVRRPVQQQQNVPINTDELFGYGVGGD